MKSNNEKFRPKSFEKSFANSSTPIRPIGNARYRLEEDAKRMIKGKLAETIVAQLFLDLGYSVDPFGIEYAAPTLTDTLRSIPTLNSIHLRHMPDFVMINEKLNEVFFIEVKFRGNGIFDQSHISADYRWRETFFIVLTRKHIKCITYDQLKSGQSVHPDCKNYLGWRQEFNLNNSLVRNYCKFVKDIFQSF